MASVYKRKLKSGTYWFGAVQLSDGTWKKYNTGLRTDEFKKKVASEHAHKVQQELDAGRDPFRQTVKDHRISSLASKYVEERKPFWGSGTVPIHTHTLRLLGEAVGAVSVTSLEKNHVKRFVEFLKARGARNTGKRKPLSTHTLNIHLRNLRAFLRWAGEETGWVPPRISELPVPASGHRDYYTVEECRKLIAAASEIFINEQPFSGFLTLLVLTGMRKGEALALEWRWVDLSRQQILIPPEVTKTQHKRAVPLTRALGDLLSSWPRNGERVFALSSGSGHVDEMYNIAVARAGIRRLKLHNLRDTFAVHSLLAGVPLAVVSAILGHASVVTTIKHYGAIAGEELQVAAVRSVGFSTAILPAMR